jgi:hypothetical protein
LRQRDQIRIGAERPGSGLDGGGFGFAGYLDVRRPRFAVQSGGIGVGLRLGANGVGFRVRLSDGDLRLYFFTFGVLRLASK